MTNKLFQHKLERSNSSHAILETTSRKRKALKIQAILEQVTDLPEARLLDIGTGSGDIASNLAEYTKEVFSVDIVDERKNKNGYKFKLVKDEALPFKEDYFDVVVTNHVVEHTPNQDKHFKEVQRVLKPTGVIYLATPNKLWLTDPHYKLPFISWLPRSLSEVYLKTTQKAEWDIYPLSSHGIKKKLKDAEVKNALPIILTTNAGKKLDTWQFALKLAKVLPYKILELTQFFSPTLIFLIYKHKPHDK